MYELNQTPYNMRNVNLKLKKYKRITYGKRSLSYEGAWLYNTLSSDFRNIDDILDFKRLINSWEGPQCRCGECILCHGRTIFNRL